MNLKCLRTKSRSSIRSSHTKSSTGMKLSRAWKTCLSIFTFRQPHLGPIFTGAAVTTGSSTTISQTFWKFHLGQRFWLQIVTNSTRFWKVKPKTSSSCQARKLPPSRGTCLLLNAVLPPLCSHSMPIKNRKRPGMARLWPGVFNKNCLKWSKSKGTPSTSRRSIGDFRPSCSSI